MRFLKTIQLIWTFYKGFVPASALITLLCLGIFRKYGWSSFSGIFWCKVLTGGLIYYFVNDYKQREYYYYQNLGVSKTLLWTASFSFDFALFLFLLILM